MKKIPNSMCWNITNKCNDYCKFCYRDKISEDLSFEEQITVIDKLSESGIKKITFAGGEPLLNPNIVELIKYAKVKGHITALTTNAILLDESKLKALDGYLDWIGLSLDSLDKKIQSDMGRNEKHVDRVLNLLETINELNLNMKVKINTLVTNLNKDTISDIIFIINKYNISRWKLFQFVSLRGDSKINKNLFNISDEQFDEVAKEIRNLVHEKNCVLSISDKKNIENAYFVIFPNGDIKISSNLQDRVVGNVLTDNIIEIWNNEEYNEEKHQIRTKFINRVEKKCVI